MDNEIYIVNGYKNREDYLKSLSEEYGVPYFAVEQLANILGPSEDFDGLVNALEDYQLDNYYPDIDFDDDYDDWDDEEDEYADEYYDLEDEYLLDYDDDDWEDYDE